MSDTECNCCGSITYIPCTITGTLNFGSIYDCSEVSLRLCPKCFDTMVDRFRTECKIDPVKEYFNSEWMNKLAEEYHKAGY